MEALNLHGASISRRTYIGIFSCMQSLRKLRERRFLRQCITQITWGASMPRLQLTVRPRGGALPKLGQRKLRRKLWVKQREATLDSLIQQGSGVKAVRGDEGRSISSRKQARAAAAVEGLEWVPGEEVPSRGGGAATTTGEAGQGRGGAAGRKRGRLVWRGPASPNQPSPTGGAGSSGGVPQPA